MAKFLELALDTVDPGSTVAEFWAPVVGGRAVVNDPRYPADVVGETEQQGISVCPVPEPKTVKNRVHLDIYARTVDELVARGATVQVPAAESGFAWTVMLDPEGNEFCAFLRDEPPAYRLHGIVIDSTDPEAQARWWGRGVRRRGDRQRPARRRLVDPAARHRRPGAHLGLRAGAGAQDRQEPSPLGRPRARSRSSSTGARPGCGTPGAGW